MLNFASIVFDLQRHSPQPLFVQLCEQIRQRIVSGQIDTRLRLPPSRNLAAELAISRSTVVTAYEQLVAEGYIEGRRGSGYYVRELAGSDYLRHRAGSAGTGCTGFAAVITLWRWRCKNGTFAWLLPLR